MPPDTSPLNRDLIGYGANPPHPRWPGDARIAVNFVLNFEEGSEPSFLDGDGRSEAALTVAELAEIVAWHDARGAMDYVTCGTGSYFDFYPIIPVSLYEQQLGVPFAAALKRVVTKAVVQAESHIRTPEAATTKTKNASTISAMIPALMTAPYSSLTSAVAPRISMTWTRRPCSMTSSSS